MQFIENWESQIKKGILDYLVLHSFKQKAMYGHQIIDYLKEVYNIEVAEGTLYPKLGKLKKDGVIFSEWRQQENDIGSPKKYYYLTGQGKLILKEMEDYIETIIQPIFTETI